MSDKIPAFSPDTGTHYDSWDDLVTVEANGYVVISTTTRPHTAPVAVGPFATKGEADRARRRLRRKWQREEIEHGYDVSTFVRVLWKEDRA